MLVRLDHVAICIVNANHGQAARIACLPPARKKITVAAGADRGFSETDRMRWIRLLSLTPDLRVSGSQQI